MCLFLECLTGSRREVIGRGAGISSDRRGANFVEYILIVAVVGLSGLAAFRYFGGEVRQTVEGEAVRVANLEQARSPDNNRTFVVGAEEGAAQDRTSPAARPATDPFPERDPWDPERIKDLRAVLERLPSGREALATIDGGGIPIQLKVGKGAYFDPDRRTITLDATMSQASLAIILVHEANHARATVERRSPKPWKIDSRDEFIRLSLDEEIEGVRLESKFWKEAHDAGIELPLRGHMNMYDYAYTKAKLEATMERPRPADEEIERRARQAAHDRMDRAMRNGEMVTSTQGKTPADNYGEQWDRYRRWPPY
jgi:hypothetical protein